MSKDGTDKKDEVVNAGVAIADPPPPPIIEEPKRKHKKGQEISDGFVSEDQIATKYPDFLKEIQNNPNLEFPILLAEKGPVFFAPRGGKDRTPKKLMPYKEYLITAKEFLFWFHPEYQFHLEFPPLKDPSKGYARENLVVLDTEWERQRMLRLERCYRDQSLAKFPSSFPGVMEASKGKLGLLPKMYAGVNVKTIRVIVSRRPLDQEIRILMEEAGIPLDKSTFTQGEVDQIIELFRPLAKIHNMDQNLADHFAQGAAKVPMDMVIVSQMQLVHNQHMAVIRVTDEKAELRAKAGG